MNWYHVCVYSYTVNVSKQRFGFHRFLCNCIIGFACDRKHELQVASVKFFVKILLLNFSALKLSWYAVFVYLVYDLIH